MSKFFRKQSKKGISPRLWESKAERAPYRKRKREGFCMCPKCHAFYFKKSWHHNTEMLAPRTARDLQINFALCPADTMTSQGLYEGEITIEKVPRQYHVELLNLIKGFGSRAYTRDCQDRIIDIKKKGNNFVVTTTENQLAQKLAKKIKQVFNKVDLTISHSREPYEVERIIIKFR